MEKTFFKVKSKEGIIRFLHEGYITKIKKQSNQPHSHINGLVVSNLQLDLHPNSDGGVRQRAHEGQPSSKSL